MTNKSTEDLIKELEALLDKGYTAEVINFLLNCLSGVPYVGGAFSATAGLRTDLSQKKINGNLLGLLKDYDQRLKQIENGLCEVNEPTHCVVGYIKFNPNTAEFHSSSKISSLTDIGSLNYIINLTEPIHNYIFNYYGSGEVNISQAETHENGLQISFQEPCPDTVTIVFYENKT